MNIGRVHRLESEGSNRAQCSTLQVRSASKVAAMTPIYYAATNGAAMCARENMCEGTKKVGYQVLGWTEIGLRLLVSRSPCLVYSRPAIFAPDKWGLRQAGLTPACGSAHAGNDRGFWHIEAVNTATL